MIVRDKSIYFCSVVVASVGQENKKRKIINYLVKLFFKLGQKLNWIFLVLLYLLLTKNFHTAVDYPLTQFWLSARITSSAPLSTAITMLWLWPSSGLKTLYTRQHSLICKIATQLHRSVLLMRASSLCSRPLQHSSSNDAHTTNFLTLLTNKTHVHILMK